jgi:hypothetical protein
MKEVSTAFQMHGGKNVTAGAARYRVYCSKLKTHLHTELTKFNTHKTIITNRKCGHWCGHQELYMYK